MLSEKALKKLLETANNPIIVLHDHPHGDAAEIAELAAFGLVQPESLGWYELSEAGYDLAETFGVSVWRFYTSKVAA
jgi:hypothetical protein